MISSRLACKEIDQHRQHDAEPAPERAFFDEGVNRRGEAEDNGEERLLRILAAERERVVIDARDFLEAGFADDFLASVLGLVAQRFLLVHRLAAVFAFEHSE